MNQTCPTPMNQLNSFQNARACPGASRGLGGAGGPGAVSGVARPRLTSQPEGGPNRRSAAALLGWLAAAVLALSAPLQAHAAKVRLCVYDPSGAAGEGYRAAMDYRLEMAQHGADIELKAYTNERVAVEDFRTDQCDAVMATALRTRQFNGMAAALDSMGAATVVRQGKVDLDASFEVVRRFIETMSEPKAGAFMVNGAYEVAGMLPLGAAYAFFNDRAITTLDGAAGKRVATFDHDKAQGDFVRTIGASAVSADVVSFGNMFNNGNVDVIIAPTMVYKPLELFRGLGSKGGVSRYPLAILTYQLVIKAERFPKGFGQKSREYMAQNFDVAIASLRLADRGVSEALWVDAPAASIQRTTALMRKLRIDMAEQGVYDKRGLKLVKKIRCSLAPEAAECSDGQEAW
jgi:hypothetical protein